MVIAIRIAPQTVAAINGIISVFGYFDCGDKLATLKFGSDFPQLTLFPRMRFDWVLSMRKYPKMVIIPHEK